VGVRTSILSLAAAAFFLLPAAGTAETLPDDFVHLSDVASAIAQDIRYAGADNVVGRPLLGYRRAVCILTREAANALARVQSDLEKRGLGLVVFDCLRPVRAVDDLVTWTKAGTGPHPRWHPNVVRGDLIAKGYVGLKSTHSRGSTVDAAVVTTDRLAPAYEPACGAAAPRMLDFGTGFDCFDDASRTDAQGISAEARVNRKLLVQAMDRHGFRNYPGEWWHFTLRNEPHKQQRFDMSIE